MDDQNVMTGNISCDIAKNNYQVKTVYYPNGVTGVHAPRHAAEEHNSDQEYATVLLVAAAAIAMVL